MPTTAPSSGTVRFPGRAESVFCVTVVQCARQKPGYLRAEFTSTLFRFVDDVEFVVVPDEGVIHFRSCSRVGYSDLGANRRRMESLRKKLNAL